MFLFWISTTLLCLLTLWVFWRTLRSHSLLKMESVSQRNIAIAKEKALEIESAYEAEELSLEARDTAKRDLEMALADELASSNELKDQFTKPAAWSTIFILLLLPFFSFALYHYTSNYQADQHNSSIATQAPPINGKLPTLAALLPQLEAKINANPDDEQGLFLLAQTYSRIGRYGDSAQRYEQLLKLVDPLDQSTADLLANYADVRAMANGQQFSPEIAKDLDSALRISPLHIKALWLGGLAARQLGDSNKALNYWQKLAPLVKDNPEAANEIKGLIDGISRELTTTNNAPLASPNTPNGEPSKAALNTSDTKTQTGITVQVSIAPELLASIAPDDSVFIFAKAKTGPPMPLAARRQKVSDLPIEIHLDDSMAMLPQMKLSNFNEVLIGARISKTGQAIAQSGDLQSSLISSSNNNAEVIKIIINQVKP